MTSEDKQTEAMLPTPLSPTSTGFDHSSSASKHLRDLDDALTHAIDQLGRFNSETMSDLSLKYELMRNNESRVIGFFARQLMHLEEEKLRGQTNDLHSEYLKLDRFLLALNFNKNSIDFLVKRLTFDDVLHRNSTYLEQMLIDAYTSDTEKKDFRHAVAALKSCIDYFSKGGSNDNDRFYWHIETPTISSPTTPKSTRQHRLSDTILSTPSNNETARAASVSSSISTEFGSSNSGQHSATMPPIPHGTHRPAPIPPTTTTTRSNANGKSKWEHPSKKSFVDPSIFTPSNSNQNRNGDLPVPDGGNSSRRSSRGSDDEGRLASGSATPMSPTIRSPTLSGSPMGSAQNSDTENDNRQNESWTHQTMSPIAAFRMAHKIQHKFDRSRVFKFSFCDVCKKQIFRGKACIHCKYKCHKECVPNAPPSCGFSEGKFRRMIDNSTIQHAIAQSTPLPRKYHPVVDNSSPTPSAPPSPAPHNSAISVRETLYSTQNDPDSWVVIETNIKTLPEIGESQSDSENNAMTQTDSTISTVDSNLTISSQSRSVQSVSTTKSENSKRDDVSKRKMFEINSFDDEEADPDKRNINLDQSLQDCLISFPTIKVNEKERHPSATLLKGHWHGSVAVRLIKPNSKLSDDEFLKQFKTQVFHLRKVRHEHLNLYTGFCIESPNFAIVSNWIQETTLYEAIHVLSETISLTNAVQYAAQITQAMSYLHEKKINHMSLRTTNIFVQNTRIILTDYGLFPLSKCYQHTDQPAIIAPRGWLCYLAPELIRKLDPRNDQTLFQHTTQTDVYAFGTVWYELIFREFPFAKQPPEYIIWRAGNSLKQPLSSVHISKYAKEIINQCWSFVPDDRPDFAMLCKSLSKFPGKGALVRSPSTPLQHHTRLHVET